MLENKVIISTRPPDSDGKLIDLLHEAEANYVSLPMIAIESNTLSKEEKEILIHLEQFDWIVFTSINGVRVFFEHLEILSPGRSFPRHLRIAVVGHVTKEVLQKNGINPSLVSPGKTATDLLIQLQAMIPKDAYPKILLPLGNLAGEVLEEGLDAIAEITRINIYKTVTPKSVDSQIIQKIKEDRYDMILLASPSAFENLKKCLTPSQVVNLKLACIGPITENAVIDSGVNPKIVAERSTAVGLFESVKNYFD